MELSISNNTVKELKGTDVKKIGFYEYFLIFVLIIYAGQGSTAVSPLSFSNNPVGAFIPVLISSFLIFQKNVRFDGRFFGVLFGLFVYFIAISIKYTEIHPKFILIYVYYFFLVYILIKGMGFRMFKTFEMVHYYLAIIGLGFWLLQIGLRGDTLFGLLGRIPGIETFSSVTGKGYNIFLYSVQPVEFSTLYNFTIPRNCGYAWEPGAFAVYLCLAIFINLFFFPHDKKSNTRLWVFIITLLTTLSTTGYLIFIIIMASYLFRKNLNIIILILPVTVIALIMVASLPFMSKKVINLIDDTKRIDQLMEDYYGKETAASPQRFTSLLIAIIDFKDNPVLGIGIEDSERWTTKMGANVSTISGIGNIMAQFGLVGTLFFLIMTLRSSLFFSRYLKLNSGFLLFFIIVFISVSYSVLFFPVIMCFWMFDFFIPEDVRREYLTMLKPAPVSS